MGLNLIFVFKGSDGPHGENGVIGLPGKIY